jgi:hypothetical protein
MEMRHHLAYFDWFLLRRYMYTDRVYFLCSNSMERYTFVCTVRTLTRRRRYCFLADIARQNSFPYFLDSLYHEAVHTQLYAVANWEGGACTLNMEANLVGQSVP